MSRLKYIIFVVLLCLYNMGGGRSTRQLLFIDEQKMPIGGKYKNTNYHYEIPVKINMKGWYRNIEFVSTNRVGPMRETP